jgi:hypothetical protein
MNFPNLSRRPVTEKVITVDNYIKNDTESNHVIRRLRSTRARKKWELTYDLLSSTDASELINLFDSVNCVTSFSWVDKTGITRYVVFEEPLSWIEKYPGQFAFDTFTLTEV